MPVGPYFDNLFHWKPSLCRKVLFVLYFGTYDASRNVVDSIDDALSIYPLGVELVFLRVVSLIVMLRYWDCEVVVHYYLCFLSFVFSFSKEDQFSWYHSLGGMLCMSL